MKILVLGGAGAMGMVTVRDLAESPGVSEVIVADASSERLRQVLQWASNDKIVADQVDASNHKGLVNAMKKADAVANALPFNLNLGVMEASLESKRSMVDLGGVYHMTLRQLELDKTAKDAGVSVVVGCGLAPGIADVLAMYGARKLDMVHSVHIHYGDRNINKAKYKWAFRTVLEEYTAGPVVFKKGRFETLPPFSGKHTYEFPEPLGKCSCCYGLYSGVATLPFSINKGVKNVDCSMSYSEQDEQRIKVLSEMGLTSTEPITIEGLTISPRDLLLHAAPPPDVRVRDVAGLIVEVIGEKREEQVKYTYSLISSYNKRYAVSATAYLTGVPLSIATQMLAKGEIASKGVLPPERAVAAEPFFGELAKRGIGINETVETTRKM